MTTLIQFNAQTTSSANKTSSTIIRRSSIATTTTPTTTTTAAAAAPEHAMAWTNEKVRFSCVDTICLKQLWKLLAMDSNATKTTFSRKCEKDKNNNANEQHKQIEQFNNNNNNINSTEYKEKAAFDLCGTNMVQYLLTKREMLLKDQSLLKCLAINALDLSAPATTVLLEHNDKQQQKNVKPHTWLQLSGHPESIVPTRSGVVRKRVSGLCDNEVHAYKQIMEEPKTADIVPKFYGTVQFNDTGNTYIELQDLLTGFKDPCIMDIKLGTRTFLESEVSNKLQRHDLYEKMVAIDAHAPTAEEHAIQAVTKLRYMIFRETMSSSHTKGFRIEALRLRGRTPIKELKKMRSSEQIDQTIAQFLNHCGNSKVQHQLIKRLRCMRQIIEDSKFCQSHEIVGSSIFIVYDEKHAGAWLIDFAKSRALPVGRFLTHRAEWQPGNSEEGLLKGFDELIASFERIKLSRNDHCKCLQI